MSAISEQASVGNAGFCWTALVARVLHPVQVEIIEALDWIDRPLSGADLLKVLEGVEIRLRVQHHLRRLASLEAVVLADIGETVSASQRIYRLVRQPGYGT